MIAPSLFSGTALCLAAHTVNKYDPNWDQDVLQRLNQSYLMDFS